MREIKFRYWDKNLKRVISTMSEAWDLYKEYSECHKEKDEMFEYEEDWSPLITQILRFKLLFNEERFIPMQYTGLKDKNSKEIYEGDIVDNGYTITYSSNSKREFRYVGVVNYDVKNGCIVINNVDGQSKRLTQKNIDKNLDVKVIGNIYENPELLNQ